MLKNSDQFFQVLQQFNVRAEAMQVGMNDTNNTHTYSDEVDQLIWDRQIQFWIENNVPLPAETLQKQQVNS